MDPQRLSRRKRRQSRRGRGLGTVVAAGLAVVLLAGPWLFGPDTSAAKRLAETGTHTKGTVVRTIEEGGHLDDWGRIVVVYRTPDGQRGGQIWLDDYRDLEPGDTVTVIYDPAHPGHIRTPRDKNVAPTDAQDLAIFGFVAGLVLLVVALFGSLRLWDRWQSRRHADGPTVDEWADDLDALAATGATTVAWTEARTPRAWKHYLGRAGVRLGAAALGGMVMGGIYLSVHAKDSELRHDGVRTEATVVDTGAGGRYQQPWAEVEYPVGATRVHGILHGPEEYDEGDRVTLYYDPQKPSRFRSDEYANHNDLLDGFLVIGFFLTGLLLLDGLLIGGRALLWRRWLRRRPWHPVKAKPSWFEPWYLRDPRCYLTLRGTTLDGVPLDTVVKLGGSVFDISDGFSSEGRNVLVCSGPRHRAVLLTRTAERPYDLRLPRSPGQERRWRRLAARGEYEKS